MKFRSVFNIVAILGFMFFSSVTSHAGQPYDHGPGLEQAINYEVASVVVAIDVEIFGNFSLSYDAVAIIIGPDHPRIQYSSEPFLYTLADDLRFKRTSALKKDKTI